MLKLPVAILASFSLATNSAAATPENCVTETEAAAIFASMLPDMIDGLRDKCATHLPANSFLAGNADALIARYKTTADQQWPAAKLAFGKIAGESEAAAKMPDQFLRPLIGSMIGSEVFKDLKPADCGGANRVIENLAPLPPENVAALIGAVLAMAGDKGKDDDMPICEASKR
jgi:hypothetical protein